MPKARVRSKADHSCRMSLAGRAMFLQTALQDTLPRLFAASAIIALLLVMPQAAGADRSSTCCDERTSKSSKVASRLLLVPDSSLLQINEMSSSSSQMMPPGASTMMKGAGACILCLILYKLLSKIDCAAKRMDCRRCRLCSKLLLATGYDEFPTFRVTVTVHSVQDIKNKGLLGEKEFKVQVGFKWSKFITTPTKDMRWDQTKGMDVPQGSDECNLILVQEGKFRDSTVGTFTLETQREMISAKRFWGEKKKFKLEGKGGKLVGTLLITFRKSEDDDEDPMSQLPIDGVDEDCAMAIAIRDAHEEMVKEGLVVDPKKIYDKKKKEAQTKKAAEAAKAAALARAKGEDGEAAAAAVNAEDLEIEFEMPQLKGDLKLDCLSRCISGPLREIDKEGKEAGKVYVRCVGCNFAELQGDNMKEEMSKQWKKAQEKGLNQLEKKYYWAWYEDKKAAYSDSKWHYPDGYIPMTAISSVHRSPERNDQFVVKYNDDGKKEAFIYRREQGRGLDVWIDGIDITFEEARKQTKDKKEGGKNEEDKANSEWRAKQMSKAYFKRWGKPKNEQEWDTWQEEMMKQGIRADVLFELRQEAESGG